MTGIEGADTPEYTIWLYCQVEIIVRIAMAFLMLNEKILFT